MVREVRAADAERTRPVEAVGTRIFGRVAIEVAGSRKEQAVTVGTCHEVSILSVQSRPRPCAFVLQFLKIN